MTPRSIASKIKKLFKARDNAMVDQGLELAIASGDPEVFQLLLEGSSIDAEGRLVRGRPLDGSGPARAFLDRAFLGLVAHAPDGTQMDPSLSTNMETLDLSDSQMTQLPPALSAFRHLHTLKLLRCPNLKGIEVVGSLKELTCLWLVDCTGITSLAGVQRLKNLQTIVMSDCTSLTTAQELQRCPNLVRIVLRGCTGLTRLSLKGLKGLQQLNLDHCWKLHELELKNLPALTSLGLEGTAESYNYAGISYQFIWLRSLKLKNLTSLESLDISWSYPLETLWVEGCTSLVQLSRDVMDLAWDVHKTSDLKLVNLPELSHVRLADLPLTTTAGLRRLKGMKSVDLSGCGALLDLEGVRGMPSLTHLDLTTCEALVSLDGLDKARSLTHLVARRCPALEDPSAIRGLKKLCGLDFTGCPGLRFKPDTALLAGRSEVDNYRAQLHSALNLELPRGLKPLDSKTRKETRQAFTKFKKLIRSHEPDMIHQAVSLAVALDSKVLLERLLYGGALWFDSWSLKPNYSPSVFFTAPTSGPKWQRRERQKILDEGFKELAHAAPEASLLRAGFTREMIAYLIPEGGPGEDYQDAASWSGHYLHGGREWSMAVDITFDDGQIQGGGTDSLESFSIHGTCDPKTGEVQWNKQYLGDEVAHVVTYEGRWCGKAIVGRWSIDQSGDRFYLRRGKTLSS